MKKKVLARVVLVKSTDATPKVQHNCSLESRSMQSNPAWIESIDKTRSGCEAVAAAIMQTEEGRT